MNATAQPGARIKSWDIFCRVVDNYGDAAVCWRLARELSGEHGGAVRLWIDQLGVLHALCPSVVADKPAQSVDGVSIRHWTSDVDFGAPAEIAVEGFGCGMPEAYSAAMAAQIRPPIWITLEYLSAEPWVARYHGLSSPHPQLSLERYFFFPGFLPGTGGLLKEHDLDARRSAFQNSRELQTRFWRGLGFEHANDDGAVASLFGYANPAAGALLEVWVGGKRPMVAAVPVGPLRKQVCAFFGVEDPGDGATLQRGSLEVRLLPFLPQERFDELLWACGWNFVRGEDSMVRAQWAARPLIWQLYPQEALAHEKKLEAFLDIYCTALDRETAEAFRRFTRAWNQIETPDRLNLQREWEVLGPRWKRLAKHAGTWLARLAETGELAENLVQFCAKRLK